jgi:2-amino-4-hydroxy-6-hydroxymethyldihydropteridine diphosphokinase
MILIALGANLSGPWGTPREGLGAALGQFPAYGLQVEAASALYQTPAVTPYAQPDFVNAVARISTALDPSELLKQLHRIEAAFGRVRSQRWEERTLDLDLIDYNGLILRETVENRLILPHPRAAERAFVLGPLVDVAPEWRHPVLSASVSELLAAQPGADRAGLVRLDAASKA